MAVIEIKNPSSLKLRLNVEDGEGNVKVRTKSFSNVKPDTTAQNAFDIGYAIASLQTHGVLDIVKQDNTILG